MKYHPIWIQSILSYAFVMDLVFIETETSLNVKSPEIELSNLKANEKNICIINKSVIFLSIENHIKYYTIFINNFSWFCFVIYVEHS